MTTSLKLKNSSFLHVYNGHFLMHGKETMMARTATRVYTHRISKNITKVNSHSLGLQFLHCILVIL